MENKRQPKRFPQAECSTCGETIWWDEPDERFANLCNTHLRLERLDVLTRATQLWPEASPFGKIADAAYEVVLAQEDVSGFGDRAA